MSASEGAVYAVEADGSCSIIGDGEPRGLCATGLIVTYIYNRIVAKTLFSAYKEEQFLAMFGMLTGTASSGIILLREIDGEFKTPVADNLVYQNFPAIVFGFPLMLIANWAPNAAVPALLVMAGFFIIMNIILFREQIFKKFFAKKAAKTTDNASEE
jgi:ESS family glutamate:Na+ symporter